VRPFVREECSGGKALRERKRVSGQYLCWMFWPHRQQAGSYKVRVAPQITVGAGLLAIAIASHAERSGSVSYRRN
jgi:hypothetical protein